MALNGDIKSKVELGNYQVEDLTWLEGRPRDADIVINGAQSDLTAYEADLCAIPGK